jgi:thymidine phosphorylase
MISTAASAGLRTSVLLTDMSEPLARSAGNALELREALAMLKGEGCDARLLEVTLALGAEAMLLGSLARDEAVARAALGRALESGAALDRFVRMVASLGGPSDLAERPDDYLAVAPVIVDVPAPHAGCVTAIDTRELGLVVVSLGGGRSSPAQAIDPAVGLDRLAPRGTKLRRGDPLARVHAATVEKAAVAAGRVAKAFTVGESPTAPPPLVERV